MTVTAAHHPLCGERLAVEGRRRVGGAACLIVRLPDGTPGTIELSATSCAPAEGAPACGLLSVEGPGRIDRLWESFSPAAQERILRLLAGAIARVLSVTEEQR